VLRTEKNLSADVRKKVALFCNVDAKAVIQSIDVSTIYEVPVKMQEEGLDEIVLKKLQLPVNEKADLNDWKAFLAKLKGASKTVTIGLVGKYVELADAYKSIIEALIHAATYNDYKVQIKLIQSEQITADNIDELLAPLQGILVAPGFGHRGIEGKILAVKYAREKNVPFFGICLGMQCAVIEYARNVLGLQNANSREMDHTTPYSVIDLMEDQKNVTDKGGTMRLGAYDCRLVKASNAQNAYKNELVRERHRHRYEFNNEFLDAFQKGGMKATGINPDTGLVEIVEIPTLKWFTGVQFHPEYSSTVLKPHPLFMAFVKASIEQKESQPKK
jgi:CTP synthase